MTEDPNLTFEDAQLIAFLQRSYSAVDGLWFVMCEQELGFDQALELDDRVWQVMPKIQVRKAREVLGLTGHTPAELARALALKYTCEGHAFRVAHDDAGVTVTITDCPWRALLAKSDRLHLAATIGLRICTAEGAGWAREFGQAYEFTMPECMCEQAGECRLTFTRRVADSEATGETPS